MPNERETQGHTAEHKVKVEWWQTKNAKMAGTAILVVAVASVLVWLFAFHPYVSTDDARISADIVNVANMGSGGQILTVNVKEGDVVTNGMVLAELDHRIAEAQFQQAKAKEEFAEASFKRVKALSGGAGSTKQQFDMANSDATSAESAMKLAEIALERTYIKSPVDGIVIQKAAVAGNILEANQVAFTVADIEHAWVSANINEKSISRVKPGQPVRIKIDEGGKLKGKVAEVRDAAASVFSLIPSDNASGNFIKVSQRIPLKIVLDPHPGRVLRVGESVEITIKVQ
jgi:membrane fusion protein (multidrug efflux system)